MPKILNFILIGASLLACSGGENFDPNADPQFSGDDSSRKLGSNNLSQWSTQVHAKATWQSAGISVSKGQKLLIRASGEWSGGQLKIGSSDEASSILFCDADGCDGEKFLPVSEFNLPERSAVPATPDVCGREAGYTQLYDYHPDNVVPRESALQNAFGFANGEVDGERICFDAADNYLGSDKANLNLGWWARRRAAWESNVELFTRCGYPTTHPQIYNFAVDMAEAYRNATCENPLTENQIATIIARARDAGYLWRNTEPVYEPTYFAEVPENNYKIPCNSESETVLAFRVGKVSEFIPKNHCYPGKLNSLIMKIVPPGTRFEDAPVILIGKKYERSAFEVPRDGLVYFRNNDFDNGIGDNAGSLIVSLGLAASTSQD